MNKLNYLLITTALMLYMFNTSVCLGQTGQIILNQEKNINILLNLKKEINRDELNTDRHKIQVYSGSRTGANKSKQKFDISFPDWKSTIQYETPNFKIWAGNYRTRLEADRALKIIKKKFPNAFIFQTKK